MITGELFGALSNTDRSIVSGRNGSSFAVRQVETSDAGRTENNRDVYIRHP
jgi:hypothetical protein